ncbi:hypothetical protein FC70_GL001638 [Paucilactobacillus oligofermentans DSM 15707 = LMG 22743]|uniref:Extracellular protein n=1 Tax=Paucilactobacillus oligofermentans DSM 15707 = LMG 22743 TaxID=1423778 RepID=A0A0R1RHX7_9LACO|nr:YpmS family protein [Paucilactobacillus oligofermentans]KRL54836.1 hypothetical protein FC70_GL001638 [Paucilactobacillus oligofermentans DSM 15707 = LMG 22743]
MWKWAFGCVIALIVILIAYVMIQVTAPVENANESDALATNKTTFNVKLNSTQVNALADNYLTRLQNKQNYSFIVGKQYATVSGSTKFLGAKVAFAVNFVPVKQKDGNVLLKAKGMSVGRLNLPATYVLGYISKNNKLPEWVTINQRKKTVLLDLNKYSKKQSVHYAAKKIDLANKEYIFSITIPKQ